MEMLSNLRENRNFVRDNRNFGIDLLRILSMMMVVINHLISQGGVIENVEMYSTAYWVLVFLETLCYCAVNTFILISGYVGYSGRFQYTNIISLWLTVECYSIGLTLLEKILTPTNVKWKTLFRAAFPVCFSKYWFFTAYFCAFFFFPMIIKTINVLTKKQAFVVMGCEVVLFTIFPLISNTDLFNTGFGYSVIWFLVLYYCGVLIKRYEPLKNIKKWQSIAGYLICCVLTFIPKILLPKHSFQLSIFKIDSLVFSKYASVTMLFAAVFLLNTFKDMKLSKATKTTVSFFSPLAFSVYLIHHHEFAFTHIIENHYSFVAGFPFFLQPLCVLGCALLIFICCSGIDYIRYLLFNLLKVKERLRKTESYFLKDLWQNTDEKLN